MSNNWSNVEDWPDAVWSGLEDFRAECWSGCGGCEHAGFFTSHPSNEFLPKPDQSSFGSSSQKTVGFFSVKCARNVQLDGGAPKTYCTWREEGPPALPAEEEESKISGPTLKAQLRYSP